MTVTTATLGVLRRRWVSAGAARPPNYLLLVATVGVLNVVGGVMVLSASSVSSLTDYGSAWYFFERQVAWIAVAALAFMVTARIDFHAWRKAVRPLLVIGVGRPAPAPAPATGAEMAGPRRWLGTGMLRFQPTEIAKLAILVYTADLLARRTKDLHDWRRVLRPVLIVLAVIGALVLREPDLDSTIVLGLIAFAVLAAGGVRLRHLTLIGGTAVVAGTILALAEPYRRARVFAFLHPSSDASNAGFPISQSLIALGSGGWTGVGLGAGRAKWLFLPNAHTDFIFAIIGEELGLVGCLLVVGLFVVFAMLGTRTALRAPDRFGMLLAA